MSEGAASPRISGRELLLVALLGLVAALALHWPLPLHLGRDIAQDLGDPLVQAWQGAGGGPPPRDAPAQPVPGHPVLAAARQPRVLRRARRLRAGGARRRRRARGGRALRPA